MYIDTHAHIIPHFFSDIPNVMKKIQESDVKQIVNIATSVDEFEEVVYMHSLYPFLFPALGLHPEITLDEDAEQIQKDLSFQEELIMKSKDDFIAIGECGLDYLRLDTLDIDQQGSIKKQQELLFRKQIELAKKVNLPLIIHCRNALEECIRILKDYTNIRGVLHSADGPIPLIQEIVSLGFFVSFNGILTFKNAQHIRDIARTVPLDHILLETDSPFLAPVPFRGTTNTSANISYIYKFLANVKNIDDDVLQKQVNINAKELFTLFSY